MNRRLTLRREALAELSAADLTAVAGAAPASLYAVCVNLSALLCPQSWETEPC